MEKEKVTQQCHDLQQELAMEAEHRQEMTEEVKRLKKEVNSRCSDVAIVEMRLKLLVKNQLTVLLIYYLSSYVLMYIGNI